MLASVAPILIPLIVTVLPSATFASENTELVFETETLSPDTTPERLPVTVAKSVLSYVLLDAVYEAVTFFLLTVSVPSV